jgi:uncharacterized membrane protein
LIGNTAAIGPDRKRIQSIDILRGAVIVLMVLDHVRDFIHVSGYGFDPLDPERTTPLLYAIRWITHFCAPTFVFLAGVSAWLQYAKGKSHRELSLLLVTRGLWLILLEVTILGFGWSFSIPFMLFLQVIWAIGCSMVALAGLIWLPRFVVLGCGLAIIVGHNLLDALTPAQFGPWANLWTLLHVGGVITLGGMRTLDAYPILPWLGVMAFGYGIGQVFLAQSGRRDRIFLALGVSMIILFIVLRFSNFYGDPHPWLAQSELGKTIMVFLAVQKYPPSLLYVCGTLGPVLTVIPLIERWRGASARLLLVFGSVPLFAYVLHIYIAHALAIALHMLFGRDTAGLYNLIRNLVFNPEALNGTGLPLPMVFFTWFVVLAILYPLCRWFANVKRRRHDWWLSYL